MNRTEFVVRVRVVKDWRFRLGFWMIKVGARIAGGRVRTTDEAR